MDPQHTCEPHSIPAPEVDQLAIKLVAFALTDPHKVLELADASEKQYVQAVADGERITHKIAAISTRLAEIEQDRKRYQRILGMQDAVKDKEEVALYRGKIAALDEERAALEQDRKEIGPQQSRTAERTAFLKNISTKRYMHFNSGDGPSYQVDNGPPIRKSLLPTDLAKELTGGDIPAEKLPDKASSRGVVEQILYNASGEAVRKLFKDLGVVVKISKPKGKQYGWPAAKDRIVVELFSSQQQSAIQLSWKKNLARDDIV